MKVLVTGGCGFIGFHTVNELIAAGHEVVVIDNFLTGSRDRLPPGVRLYELDITSESVEPVFAAEKPDAVIHLAAQIDVAVSMNDPVSDARHNVLGTIRVLQGCRTGQAGKLIFASSSAVYGGTADQGLTETSSVNPLSFYGLSKSVSEQYIQMYHKLYGLRYTILRYSNVYGPGQTRASGGGVISVFLRQISDGKKPVIYGTGEQTRDFVYVKDVARANVLALGQADNEIINISCNVKTSIRQLADQLALLLSSKVSPQYLPGRTGDILHSRLDNTKAKDCLGWQPRYDLRAGLTEMYAEHLRHGK